MDDVAAAPEAGAYEGSFVVELTHFNGPLDLLLSLIRDEKIDIYDIPIARICEQFLVRMRDLALNDAAEYLEMAARLLRIKAHMLLPRHEGDDAQDQDRPGARRSKISRRAAASVSQRPVAA